MKYLIMTIMLAMSTVNAGENVASAIDEYIDDNPIVSGVTVAIVSPTAAPATSSTAVGASISAANATGKAKYANAGENVASAIDEYIDDNPEVVLPILVGGGVSTAGVILTKTLST
jgi:ElaB/YqjD/DUF883 family membrane-anchored ribosome-binding protein